MIAFDITLSPRRSRTQTSKVMKECQPYLCHKLPQAHLCHRLPQHIFRRCQPLHILSSCIFFSHWPLTPRGLARLVGSVPWLASLACGGFCWVCCGVVGAPTTDANLQQSFVARRCCPLQMARRVWLWRHHTVRRVTSEAHLVLSGQRPQYRKPPMWAS